MLDPSRFGPWVSAQAQAMFAVETGYAPPPEGEVEAIRNHYDLINRERLAAAREQFAVEIVRDVIGGIPVDIVTPTATLVDDRTLLCLHGGAFMWGRGAGALLEAVPVAATATIRVVAVEYALAPECLFPRAVEDVVAVYRTLLERQPAASIGIFGCSAGGVLTAQVTARLIADGIALPAAIAMLCGAGLDMVGDSVDIAAAFTPPARRQESPTLERLPYLGQAATHDPLVLPGEHPDLLARFPPSLLVTGTRDFAASSVTTMHRRLRGAGVDAALLHFDGMWHAFHMATTMPEAQETFAALAQFFTAHLR